MKKWRGFPITAWRRELLKLRNSHFASVSINRRRHTWVNKGVISGFFDEIFAIWSRELRRFFSPEISLDFAVIFALIITNYDLLKYMYCWQIFYNVYYTFNSIFSVAQLTAILFSIISRYMTFLKTRTADVQRNLEIKLWYTLRKAQNCILKHVQKAKIY